MKILVTGGRNYDDSQHVNKVLADAVKHYGKDKVCIIQGGAKGADLLAKNWAFSNGICCITIEAQWNIYDKKAGSLRNRWMIEFCNPDIVIAFKGGSGTSHMKSIAGLAEITVYEV